MLTGNLAVRPGINKLMQDIVTTKSDNLRRRCSERESSRPEQKTEKGGGERGRVGVMGGVIYGGGVVGGAV